MVSLKEGGKATGDRSPCSGDSTGREMFQQEFLRGEGVWGEALFDGPTRGARRRRRTGDSYEIPR